ncbi:hydantoinase/oxoprolinase family protein [Ilumatobacter coccineus]|uniref:Putative hydantoinase A n=1 Tax=Ilumatobacter coccineus (strain NBRC 103263 / KCTC 29153 / YM16-304) TaxID=1313172 RepID=A0A6C7E6A5_ILUCY|nr:hydantoinase/oxoprolinase family protein [Ilumatobacter coccineus]BAN02317.1 putative hydantoinase A [Ilumatobacter coccineus YM16-304]
MTVEAATGNRIAADVGGTFTDVVLERPDGTYASTKVLTTHDAPERGILDGVTQLMTSEAVEVGDVAQFVHGTTLATNALIERRGAKTAFITTEGFRDVIETRTESRFEQYDLDIVLPTPLIERKDRFTLSERRNARGEELIALADDEMTAMAAHIATSGYESVAVGFIHSYVDATNEQRMRAALLDAAPQLSVSISSDVSPQMREYERFNTVCANAYVQPLMASYLVRLRDQLIERGISCPLYLVHSGGGLMSVESAAAFPVRLVESGPAGGAIFAADLAARYGRDRVVSYDMGGTTAKITLIEDYRPQTTKTFEVDRTARFKKGSGMPISIPVIDMIEIGAGGGSIASVDRLGQIRIGPHSAGSEPGPAAYSLGGEHATVTDANLELGRLHPDTFGATDIDLSPELASRALLTSVGAPLGLDAPTAAVGIAEVVDENMANAARAHAVENGKDMAGYTMIAFGGGAPLHAARLMDKLGLDELIVPPGAGVGSAIGFLVAPFSYEAVRSFYTTTADFDVDGSNAVLAELTDEALAFVRQGTSADVVVERQVSMRYVGQGWEIPVTLDEHAAFDDRAADLLTRQFTKAYEVFFGRAIDDLAIEAVSWSVRVSSVVPRRRPTEIAATGTPTAKEFASRDAYDSVLGERTPTSTLDRGDLAIGEMICGPAIISESQTTTVLGAHHRCTVQPDGTLLITRTERQEATS